MQIIIMRMKFINAWGKIIFKFDFMDPVDPEPQLHFTFIVIRRKFEFEIDKNFFYS